MVIEAKLWKFPILRIIIMNVIIITNSLTEKTWETLNLCMHSCKLAYKRNEGDYVIR